MMKHNDKMVDTDDWYLAMQQAEAARLARKAQAEQERRKHTLNNLRRIIDTVFIMACAGVVLFCIYLALWGGR